MVCAADGKLSCPKKPDLFAYETLVCTSIALSCGHSVDRSNGLDESQVMRIRLNALWDLKEFSSHVISAAGELYGVVGGERLNLYFLSFP